VRSELIEIACDESGYEGEKLIGGTTRVFAHASVRLSPQAATDCILELRERIRSPAREYKAGHLLREKHRSALIWFLGTEGPVLGASVVLLVDKTFRLVDNLAEALSAGQASRTAAVTLYRHGAATFGNRRWETFLDTFNDLVRAKDGFSETVAAASFQHATGLLELGSVSGPVGRILSPLELDAAAAVTRARAMGRSNGVPVLDPLIPAIARAVSFWGGKGDPVSMVHDRQNLLTKARIARLEELVGETAPGLERFALVDSLSDQRVQVADFLAGVARKIAEEELNGRSDPELAVLLSPYVDRSSSWGDDRSWARLTATER
jgi:hypothetical protein